MLFEWERKEERKDLVAGFSEIVNLRLKHCKSRALVGCRYLGSDRVKRIRQSHGGVEVWSGRGRGSDIEAVHYVRCS
jgi:hypothetical protein